MNFAGWVKNPIPAKFITPDLASLSSFAQKLCKVAITYEIIKKQANKISGRAREQLILDRLFATEKSEFLTLYGRRRVGKTFLVRNFFDKKPCLFFYVTGIQEGKLKEQLGQFTKQISTIFYEGLSIVPYKSWSEAFEAHFKQLEISH